MGVSYVLYFFFFCSEFVLVDAIKWHEMRGQNLTMVVTVVLLPLPVYTTLLYFLFLCSTSSSCVYYIDLLPLPLFYFLFLCILHCSTSSSCVYYIALLPLPVCTTLLYFLFLCSTSSSRVYILQYIQHTQSLICASAMIMQCMVYCVVVCISCVGYVPMV